MLVKINNYKLISLGIIVVALMWSIALAEGTNGSSNDTRITPAIVWTGNPALKMFHHAITFYVSFDRHTKADMSMGKPTAQSKGKLQWAEGIYGGAMYGRNRALIYSMKNNIDLSHPGALLFWVKPLHWAGANNPRPKQLPWLNIHNHGFTLYLARQGGRTNHQKLEAVFGPHIGQASTRAIVFNGSSRYWTKSNWHLLALNWGNKSVALSVDGSKFKKDTQRNKMIPAKYGHTTNIMRLASDTNKNTPYLIDELVILKRTISNKEITKLYKKSITGLKKY